MSANIRVRNATLRVTGMHCAACSGRIERVLGKTAGVVSATVNLAAESLAVSWRPGEIDLPGVKARVEELGFGLEIPAAPELRFSVSGMTCAACQARVERVLSGLPGAVQASVNLATETALLKLSTTADPGAATEAALSAVAQAGYSLTPLGQGESASIWERKERETERTLARMRQSLSISLPFAALLFIVSMGHMVGLPLPGFLAPETSPLGFALVQLLFVAPVVFAGRGFYTRGLRNLVKRAPNMDSLIAVGTGAALAHGLWNTVEIALGREPFLRAMDLYYESAGVIVALVHLGKYLETKSKARSSSAVKRLMDLAPQSALVIRNGVETEIPAQDVRVGDLVRIKPGGRIPVDGLLVEGESAVDESMLTGESIPVGKTPGDAVAAGTVNVSGSFVFRAERIGSDTVLAGIVRLVESALAAKAPIADLADRAAGVFTPFVMALALVSGVAWALSGAGESFSLRIAIAVLVIACPCAMGLATPISIMVGTGRGAELGILVKSGRALEAAAKVRTVVFDKTGTLTKGRPEAAHYVRLSGYPEETALALAASVETLSEHPLARAVVRAATERGLTTGAVREFEAGAGFGVRGQVDLDGRTHRVFVGNREWLETAGAQLNSAAATAVDLESARGRTPLLVSVDGAAVLLIGVADAIRPEAGRVIERLAAMGIQAVMLTGDVERVAKAVGEELGLTTVVAGVKPDGKLAAVEELTRRFGPVAMVGDGVNDAPALAGAEVGIALAGVDAAVEAGDLVLMRRDLTAVVAAVELSRAVVANIKQNLFWAFGYNVLGLPFAAGLFAAFGGPSLSPMLAGAAMAFSSVSVTTNALRLRRFQPSPL